MLAHKNRFDDALLRELSETMAGLPGGSESAKVCPGDGGRLDELPSMISERIDRIWEEQITEELGYGSFAELEAAL